MSLLGDTCHDFGAYSPGGEHRKTKIYHYQHILLGQLAIVSGMQYQAKAVAGFHPQTRRGGVKEKDALLEAIAQGGKVKARRSEKGKEITDSEPRLVITLTATKDQINYYHPYMNPKQGHEDNACPERQNYINARYMEQLPAGEAADVGHVEEGEGGVAAEGEGVDAGHIQEGQGVAQKPVGSWV